MQASRRCDATQWENAVSIEKVGWHPSCEDISPGPADLDVTFRPALSHEYVLKPIDFLVDFTDFPSDFHGLVEEVL